MTNRIFFDYIEKFESQLINNSVILLDNFSGHFIDQSKFQKLKILFLPPRTTSVFQPIYQGIGRILNFIIDVPFTVIFILAVIFLADSSI